jgi:UDP-N-acetylmuramoylalanine--D-glutamate ligase
VRSRPPIPAGPYLVVGLARSGSAAARVLHARGEHVVGIDRGAPPAAPALAAEGIEVHLQTDGLEQLDGVRTVVKSPGVPARAPALAAARAAGLTVLGELELAWRLLPNELIAVTGTNGKTTTVHWIAHIHRAAGLPVALAGNVGDALSGLVGRIDPDVTVVCEVSSFQLEDTLAFAPDAAVLLNLSADHLDRHATLAAYVEAKLRIFARQGPGDLAVLGPGLHDTRTAPGVRRVRCGAAAAPGRSGGGAPVFAGRTAPAAAGGAEVECTLRDGRLLWLGQPLLAAGELRLRGAHNLENALAAAAVCLARGLDPDAVRAGLRSFAGVAHRLEEVARRDGVLYVNDSKATNVASTLVALEAFARTEGADAAGPGALDAAPRAVDGGQGAFDAGRRAVDGGRGARVHLILGGQGKSQDFRALRDPVAAACRAVYLIGEDAQPIARALADAGVPLHECRELERAVAAARAAAAPGEIVLLSPACASFDQFTDYEARGERFAKIARSV